MEHQLEIFQNSIIGLMMVLLISCFLYLLARKIKYIPYTVLLVLVGVFVQPGHFAPFDAIRLNPGMVLYLILPILLFESAFNFDFKEFRKVLAPSFLFATIGLIISAVIIALPLHFVFDISFSSALLFGSVISSTDPIAVLAIFKQLGVPRKLQLLVDGESFLNDGTSVIMYKILLRSVVGVTALEMNGSALLISGVGDFIIVFFGGAFVGLVLGWIFAQIISSIENSNFVEILLTIILAISVFVLAEHYLEVSGILAVLAAGLIMGNYGRTKISPKILHQMHQTWEMIVFVATSLVFLLIGYEIEFLGFLENYQIILLTIFALLIGRAVSVYLVGSVYSLLVDKRDRISAKWLHIVNLGGLRGSLPLVMLLLIPETFYYRELFIDVVLGVIFFTLLFNASVIGFVIKKLNINKLSRTNELEMNIVEVIILEKVLRHLDKMKDEKELREHIYNKHKNNLEKHLRDTKNTIDKLLTNKKDDDLISETIKILDRYCVNLEKSVYSSLYYKGVISENIYRSLKISIHEQLERINSTERPLEILELEKKKYPIFFDKDYKDKISIGSIVSSLKGNKFSDHIKDIYLYHKARYLGNIKVLHDLENLNSFGFKVFSKSIITRKIQQYEEVKLHNLKTLKHIEATFPDIADTTEEAIFESESDEILYSMIKRLGEEERVSLQALQNLDLKI